MGMMVNGQRVGDWRVRGGRGCGCGCGCSCGGGESARSPFGVCVCERPMPYLGDFCAKCARPLRPTVIY